MALVEVGDAWSAPLVTAAATVFQVRSGHVFLDIGGAAAADSTDGLMLASNPDRSQYDRIEIPTGVTVRWRRAAPRQTSLYYAGLAP